MIKLTRIRTDETATEGWCSLCGGNKFTTLPNPPSLLYRIYPQYTLRVYNITSKNFPKQMDFMSKYMAVFIDDVKNIYTSIYSKIVLKQEENCNLLLQTGI